MADPRPIGMFDSGIGGFAVLREVRRLLPHESIIYVADQSHLPYGPRPRDEVRAFAVGIIRFLLSHNAKLVVIPCNTANAAALHYARGIFPDLPIVGMEPAIKPAAQHTKSGTIGVIMTQATFQSELFASVVDRFANGLRVEAKACPALVILAEQGAPQTPQANAEIAACLAPLKEAGIDELVLACTHFTFLESQLRAYLGPGVEIIDPAPAVARQTARILDQRGLANTPDASGSVRYVTSGNVAHMRQMLVTLLHEDHGDVRAAQWDNAGQLVEQDTARS
ncbi:MAG TPA: glutamate racemase [Aggregatilineales bacterium]|nr:glutamate racemase [Aggregatilineales bacterium]